jgi:hypothetical protein
MKCGVKAFNKLSLSIDLGKKPFLIHLFDVPICYLNLNQAGKKAFRTPDFMKWTTKSNAKGRNYANIK